MSNAFLPFAHNFLNAFKYIYDNLRVIFRIITIRQQYDIASTTDIKYRYTPTVMTVDGKKLKFETHYNCSIIKTLNIITFPAELSIKNNNQNIKNGKITTRKTFWQCVRHIILYNYT